jgi:hypothetical protein
VIDQYGITLEQISTYNPSVSGRTFRNLRAEREEHFGTTRLEELLKDFQHVALRKITSEAA